MTEVKIEESVDRISSLPDSVLGHILSFLPTNVAPSTSILLSGSRWRDIYSFCNNLDFNKSPVNNPNDTHLFMDFVDRCFILKHGTRIDKFRLKCSNSIDISRIHSWIYAALLCNVRELDLCIGERRVEEEYSHAFPSNTLVVLKLGNGFSLNVTASVYFPCLTILHLESVRLARTESSLERLVSSCPVLEDLLILGCYMEDVPILSLSSPSLKRLAIDKPFDPYILVLDTPSLVYLKFAVCMSEGYILKNLGSLREARVHMSSWFHGGIAHHELVEGLGDVELLYLSGRVEKFLPTTLDVLEEPPLLKNVTRLVLTGRPYLEMSDLMQLLQYCPNLEEFVSDGSIYGGYDVPCCVPSRLKSIECAMFYAGEGKVVESLEYFLKNANMLEKIHIWLYSLLSHREASEKLETLKKLAKAPSRSKTCEIFVFFNGERNILEAED